MEDIDVRHTEPHELLEVTNAKGTALLAHPMTQILFDEGRASWEGTASISAWDRDRCVGHVGAYAFDVTVPGGARLPMAGVTRVGVVSTHTRRGLLRRMMDQTLREAKAAGQSVASLYASETPIYRRYGFGLASERAAVEIDTRAARPLRVGARHGAMRLLDVDEVATTLPAVYDRAARVRPATIGRAPWMWQRILKGFDRAADEVMAPGKFVAVHSTDGVDDGYVRYKVEWAEEFSDNPTGVGVVHELWGATPEVDLALWDYLLGIDLITRWRGEERPASEPVAQAMLDRRASRTLNVFDDQWVRLLDVDAALRARSFGPTDRAVVVEVDDPMFADNRGCWSVSSDGAERSDAAPDLSVGVDVLSALYHGGQRWRDLAAIGAVEPHGTDPARTLARADALFSSDRAPFCGTGY